MRSPRRRKLVGAPVKWIEDRSEAMVATIHGRDQLQHVELAADRDGRVRAIRIKLVQDCGAYLQLLTPSIAHLTVFMVSGAYDIQQLDITCLERVHEHDADGRLSRRRPARGDAHDRADDGPARRRARHRSGGGAAAELHHASSRTPPRRALSYDSGNYEGALDKALELADYAGFEARRAEAQARGNHRGIGLSTWVEICGLAPSAVTHALGIGSGGWESSILRLHPTATATVITGSSAHGQGHATLVADRRERTRHPVRRHRRDPR